MEKRKLYIDLFKFFFSICIMSIHCMPIQNDTYWFINGIARLGVPFFFICSGYFFSLLSNNPLLQFKRINKYICLYLFWMTIYLFYFIDNLQFIHTSNNIFIDITKTLYIAFIAEGYFHLWYLLALIQGSTFLILFLKYLNLNITLILALLLYIIGLLGDVYQMYDSFDIAKPFILIWGTTRSALTFAFPLLYLGYITARLIKKFNITHYILFFIINAILFIIEINYIYSLGVRDCNLYFTSPTLVVILLIIILKLPDIRLNNILLKVIKSNDIIYFIHPLIFIYLLPHIKFDNVWRNYIIIILITTIISFLVTPFIRRIYSKFYNFYENITFSSWW